MTRMDDGFKRTWTIFHLPPEQVTGKLNITPCNNQHSDRSNAPQFCDFCDLWRGVRPVGKDSHRNPVVSRGALSTWQSAKDDKLRMEGEKKAHLDPALHVVARSLRRRHRGAEFPRRDHRCSSFLNVDTSTGLCCCCSDKLPNVDIYRIDSSAASVVRNVIDFWSPGQWG